MVIPGFFVWVKVIFLCPFLFVFLVPSNSIQNLAAVMLILYFWFYLLNSLYFFWGSTAMNFKSFKSFKVSAWIVEGSPGTHSWWRSYWQLKDAEGKNSFCLGLWTLVGLQCPSGCLHTHSALIGLKSLSIIILKVDIKSGDRCVCPWGIGRR